MYIEFNDGLMVGNKVIDQEHKTLVDYINLLHKAIENDSSEWIMRKILNGLKDYTLTHFFVEEELMSVYEYPDMENHKSAHEAFKAKVNELEQEFVRGNAKLTEAVMEFLKDWLTNHILKVDAKLAEFLKDKSMA